MPDTTGRPVWAAILAGGTGTRLGHVAGDLPKQLLEVSGRPIIEHTIAAFDAAPEVTGIVVAMVDGHTGAVTELIAAGGYRKVRTVLTGGRTRGETSVRALAAIEDRDGLVLLHDAARPVVEPHLIAGCVAALADGDAAVVAVPSSDTLITVNPADTADTGAEDGHETVRAVPDRATLRRVQTPQGFALPVIRRAYELAAADTGSPTFVATDDAGVVLRYLPDVPVRVVPGSERNIKVTHPGDLPIVARLLAPNADGTQGAAGTQGEPDARRVL